MAREYIDLGVSGSRESRTQLDAMMREAKRRRFVSVLVWKLDRLGRSTKHLTCTLAELDALGIAFASLSDSLAWTCPRHRSNSCSTFWQRWQSLRSWDVKSDSVALSDHVGHTVTATGTVSNVTMHNAKEEAKDAAAAAGAKKENNEHGDMEITSVKMVSKTCK